MAMLAHHRGQGFDPERRKRHHPYALGTGFGSTQFSGQHPVVILIPDIYHENIHRKIPSIPSRKNTDNVNSRYIADVGGYYFV
jgi:hypothetical protein